jgi:endonuclease/exonuclease/phosphatase family metal-dependent hydrolase
VTFVPSLLLAAALAGPPLDLVDPCRQVSADPGPSFPCATLTAAGSDRTPKAALRVATYNVHFGRDVAGLARAIEGNRDLREADVLVLQEIERYPGDGRPEALAHRLGMDVVYAPARPKGEGTHGIAILSRFPMRDLEVIALPHFELGWGTRRRVALAATIDWGGTEVRIVDVHLDTRLTADQRRRQIGPVLEREAGWPRVVIAGDMNTISCLQALLPGVPVALPGLSQGPAFDRFLRERGYVAPFRHIGGTGPLGQRLDGIFVRGLDVGDFDKEDGVHASDHVPLWADVRSPGAGAESSALDVPETVPAHPTY